MPSPRDTSLLVRAATLYYLDGLSQADVATELGVTRSNVSRVLSDARRLGIVEIRIHDPSGRAESLEAQMVERFGLRECYVAPAGVGENALTRVGALGASWLDANLPASGAVAVSWGTAVQSVVEAVSPGPRHPSIEVLPLVGGLSNVDSARDANVLVRALAAKLGATHRRLYAPAVVDSEETRDTFLRESSIGRVLEDAGRAAIAIVGIGTVGAGASSAIVESMRLNAHERAEFEAAGPVGDCCTRFFDAEGKPIRSVVDERVVAIELDALARIPTVVGVAAGANKAPGLRAALHGRLFNVLVIDSALAEQLLAS